MMMMMMMIQPVYNLTTHIMQLVLINVLTRSIFEH